MTQTISFLRRSLPLFGIAAACIFNTGCSQQDAPPSSTSNTSNSNSGAATSDSKSSDTSKSSQAKAPKVKVNLAEINAAKKLISITCSQIAFMTTDELFEKSITGKDNALGVIDIAAVKKALDLVATLPDNNDNTFIKPVSYSVPKLREAFDLYEQSLADKKPFSDGSDRGKKMAALAGEYQLQLTVAIDESLKITDNQ